MPGQGVASYYGRRRRNALLVVLGLLVLGLAAAVLLQYSALRSRRAAAAQEALEAESILDFQSELRLQSSGEELVTELIRVTSAGERVKRGLVRRLPPVFFDRSGVERPVSYILNFARLDRRRLQVDPAGVPRDGMLEYFLGEGGAGLQPGEHIFNLQYQMKRAAVSISGRRELNWDATGVWPLLIRRATAVIKLPARVDPGKVECYGEVVEADPEASAGEPPRLRTVEKAAAAVEPEPLSAGRSQVRVQLEQPLEPGRRLMVFAAWPAEDLPLLGAGDAE